VSISRVPVAHTCSPTEEAEIRRIMVRSQPRQIVPQDLISKNLHKNRAGGVAQGENPEFRSQYCKKKISEYVRCECDFRTTFVSYVTELVSKEPLVARTKVYLLRNLGSKGPL
jgi:hypothetical protein